MNVANGILSLSITDTPYGDRDSLRREPERLHAITQYAAHPGSHLSRRGRNRQTGEPWEQDTMVIVYSWRPRRRAPCRPPGSRR